MADQTKYTALVTLTYQRPVSAAMQAALQNRLKYILDTFNDDVGITPEEMGDDENWCSFVEVAPLTLLQEPPEHHALTGPQITIECESSDRVRKVTVNITSFVATMNDYELKAFRRTFGRMSVDMVTTILDDYSMIGVEDVQQYLAYCKMHKQATIVRVNRDQLDTWVRECRNYLWEG